MNNEANSTDGSSTPGATRAPLGHWIWLGAGLAMCALGLALAIGMSSEQGLQPDLLVRLGLSPALLLCTGLLTVALACLARGVHQGSQSVRDALDPTLILQAVENQSAELANWSHGLQVQQEGIAQVLLSLEQRLEVMRQEARASTARDSVFRLAASLDQLGARLDLRVGQVGSSLEQSMEELNKRIEKSRSDLAQRFQETIHSIGTLSAEETLAQSYQNGLGLGDVRSVDSTNPFVANLGGSREEALPREGELSLEIEKLVEGNGSMDLGLLETIGEAGPSLSLPPTPPAAAIRPPPSPPSALPGVLSETTYLRRQQVEGWWNQAK